METALTILIIAGILVTVFFLIRRGTSGSGLRGSGGGTTTRERDDTNKKA